MSCGVKKTPNKPTLISKSPKPTKRKEDYRFEALTLLDVSEEQLMTTPKIEHLFKAIGGKENVMEYLAGSEEPEARAVVTLAAKLNRDQANAIPFEAYCIAADITPKKLFGVIATEVADQSEQAMRLLSKARRAEVVQAAIDSALLPLGAGDRKLILQAEGYAVVPKNTVINGNVDNRTQTQNVAILPSVEDGVRRLSDRFNTMEPPAMIAAPVILEGDDDE